LNPVIANEYLESVKDTAKTIADDLITHYIKPGTGTSGESSGSLLPYPPYFWWESGAMWGVMLDYWSATGDSTYNDEAATSIQSQVGEDKDFMPADQAFDMGNDDQAFWALTAMTAAEANFQNPPAGSQSWLGLAQAVFNEQIGRWDNATCGGGISWQSSKLNGGYHLKATISNGLLMQIAARLARYTQDKLYADWATKLWDWMWYIGLIDHENWSVYDNTDANLNCTSVDRTQWTYNAATLLVACATMFNVVRISSPISE
jgi:mannan endo-1,6-alpha-mannosidase